MLSAVLFDIDGTLVLTGGAGMKAFSKTFEEVFGMADGTRNLSFAGRTDSGLVMEFLSSNGLPQTEENFRRFFDAYPKWLAAMLKESTGRVCPGVHEFLDTLENLKPKTLLGLLTGNVKKGAELKLSHYGLWNRFSMGAFADDHHLRNTIACIAHQRCNQLLAREIHPSEVIVIGDTPLDIECGRAIGARTLAVATGGSTREELKSHNPTWVLNDLTELNLEQILV